MKRTLILTAGALVILLAACGGSGEKKQTAADSVAVQRPSGPIPAENALTRATTVSLGGHTFHVEIRRFVDKEQPTVKDDLDQEFYDNGVEVTVMSEGSKFFHHTFKKDDFAGFVPEAERRAYVFLGMAYDDRKSGGRTLCLAAQLGQPGTGEGPAFTIEIPLDGGAFSIVRDTQQETVKQEEMGE